MEQCHKYLRVGGYLAIVIPDGILTNSSMQPVRDWIEESFRIVSVVSLPQFAFMANGAGVKSSILFLRKYSKEETKAIVNAKSLAQTNLWQDGYYKDEIKRLVNERNIKLKSFEGIENYSPVNIIELDKKEIKEFEKSEEYKEWKNSITSAYGEKIDQVKENLEFDFRDKFSQSGKNYPIFMAIAENIGYDAVARKIKGETDLDVIAVELSEFIKSIENGQDSFFA